MAEIDPMYHLVNSIINERKGVIFLGAGSSMEGRLGDKQYPGYDKLIDNILKDYGYDQYTEEERIQYFKKIIREWKRQKKPSARLSKYLNGEPGLAHYYLAALSIALFNEYNLLLYLTTNFDDLMRKAFTDLEKNQLRKFTTRFFSLPKNITGRELQEKFNNIEAHINEGTPFLVKLFGDLDTQGPIFEQNSMELIVEPMIEQLKTWLKSPTIFIGYSFKDQVMQRLILSLNTGSSIFIVNPADDIPEFILSKEGVFHIKKTFSGFMEEMLFVFEKRGVSIRTKIEKMLKFFDPVMLYPDFDLLKARIRKCSQVSIMRAEEKLPKVEINGKTEKFVPIKRKETGPDFENFVADDKKLLAVIGESGSGKSTLFYQLAMQNSEEDESFITLFYDIHYIQTEDSLKKKLASDFNCTLEKLEYLFQHFNKILTKANKKLLILIDGLNESITLTPLSLKAEIEQFVDNIPPTVKIAYSCRKVYWDYNIGSLLSELYYGSKEFALTFFSEKEARIAFNYYKSRYKFKGTYEALCPDLKRKVRDPLMLRMLAEGYETKRLPEFAPAVLIFDKYEAQLRKKFKNSILITFLYELVRYKLEELKRAEKVKVNDQFIEDEIRIIDKFSNLISQQNTCIQCAGDPFALLEDEGIISSSLSSFEKVYRFTYDRFYEYLLGKVIGKEFINIDEEKFFGILIEKIDVFQRVHFSFLQALKSEIVRLNIKNPFGCWSLYDQRNLNFLLSHPDAAIVNFTKEVLRELIFEAEKDILDPLKKLNKKNNSSLELQYLILDIAGDSPKIKPYLINGLFSGEKALIRRCINIFSKINIDGELRKSFEDMIIDRIKISKEPKKEYIIGLIYYSSVIFSIEDKLQNDPFSSFKIFWKRVLDIFQKNAEFRNILIAEFVNIFTEEGPYFFSANFRKYGMEYLWNEIGHTEKELAYRLIPLIINPNKKLDTYSQEVLGFFGSVLKKWDNKDSPENKPLFNYKLERRIAQFVLILHSSENYKDTKNILERFISTDFWISIDFSLCTMKYILQFEHNHNKEIIEDGFEAMNRWTLQFEKQHDKFFATLKEVDPFSKSYIPLEQTAKIDALFFTPPNNRIKFLEKRLTSSNKDKIRLALLCTRYLWRSHPNEVLRTLELCLNSEDKVVRKWLNNILKEIYCVYPRLLEDLFSMNNISPSEIQLIKFKPDVSKARSIEYDAYPLYKALFLRSKDRRKIVASQYKKLLDSPDLKSFCDELGEFFFSEILS